jgi:DNA-binding HxlR family transcriptional regulator
MKTTDTLRSHCGVNYGVETFGDRWSLLIIRDIIFSGKKTYGDFLNSEEGIATNVLASRLASLVGQGILAKSPSPEDGRKDFYTLTEKGLDLIPIVLNIARWSAVHDSDSYVRRHKDFLTRLDRNPVQFSDEVKALVRGGGCVFPGNNAGKATRTKG